MLINRLTLIGFKCFPHETNIDLNELTTFIGNNGVGKSAILESLIRLFGSNPTERKIKKEDFFIPLSESLHSQQERKLTLEATFSFNDEDDSLNISEYFKKMCIFNCEDVPYCKVRLEAIWRESNIPDGEIEEKRFWVLSDDEENNIPFSIYDYSKIRVHYIPALRDPQKQLKQSAGTVLYQLLKNIQWSDELLNNFNALNKDFSDQFRKENGIKTLNQQFSSTWRDLFSSEIYKEIRLNPISKDFKNILANIEATFSPSIDSGEDTLEKLSDGLKSLFYFTLIISMFQIENEILLTDSSHGFENGNFNFSCLNIFVIEEPENHLAPHYFGRVINQFRSILSSKRVQLLITSHSPTIIKRIEPEEIRYIFQNTTRISEVKNIVLPQKIDEAHKYVKEAVKAYPELYFSKIVVLGEGDSEEIVIPKIAKAFGVELDSSFISIVPLGGRHVNHFWKLLNQLSIPYITLLDYDFGREGGNWGKIKYVLKQLLEIGYSKGDLLKVKDGILSDSDLNEMHTWSINNDIERSWIEFFKNYNIFFSYPIDIDFSMFHAFPEAYKKLDNDQRGPRIKKGTALYDTSVKEAIASVYKKESNEFSTDEELSIYKNGFDDEIWFWYRYLFLGKGKPSTHIKAFLFIEDSDIIKNTPQELKALINSIKKLMESDLK